MGSVVVTAKIESLEDPCTRVEAGDSARDQARQLEVTDAPWWTQAATILAMPKRLIIQLGLQPIRSRRARTSAGPVTGPGLRHRFG